MGDQASNTASARASGPRPRPRRPWHSWLAAIFVFALGLGGARDFLLILWQDQDYLRGQFTAEGIAYFADYPLPLRVIWAVNLVGMLLGPVALLLRSRWAVPLAVASAAAQVVLMVITFAVRDRWQALGTGYSLFDIGVGVVGVLFAAYCRWMWQRRQRDG